MKILIFCQLELIKEQYRTESSGFYFTQEHDYYFLEKTKTCHIDKFLLSFPSS